MAAEIDRLETLRAALQQDGLAGFILPVNDEFMGEYIPDSAKRLQWLTGFSGSAGMVVVLEKKAAFFTDGRYTLQAQTQVMGFEIHNSADRSPEGWLAANAGEKAVIGYDPKLHTLQQIRRYARSGTLVWRPLRENPVDSLWHDRPLPPAGLAKIHALKYAGEPPESKRQRIAGAINQQGADMAVITAPDSLCWLLNIRGSDVPYTPFLLCYAMMSVSGAVTLYIDPARLPDEVQQHLGAEVTLKDPLHIAQDLAACGNLKILYDAVNSPVWFYQQLHAAQAVIIEASDPCQLPKACKNAIEQDGTRQAHIRDGMAVTRFLGWLDKAVAQGDTLTEMAVAEKLESFRQLSPLYLEPSFATIAGSGSNGAIVHYHATPDTDRAIEHNNLLLVDSGGQYPDGTTDITRTIAIGTPSAEMKRRFTLVLKGHIALACAVFPEGTTGAQLDVLARQYLWQAGLDYDHGTGHGVGSYLSVHEGPQRIGKRGGDTPLQAGMILSNEPGYYKSGEYGIRIENLVLVKEVMVSPEGKRYFGFETITLAPIDTRLVETGLMNAGEMEWLEDYNKKVYEGHDMQ